MWKIEATATGVRTSDEGTRTAERYLAAFRADRKLATRIDLSAGERLERDRLAGIDLRSITDLGLKYALVRLPAWTLDGLTSFALNHEEHIIGPDRNDPAAVLQTVSHYVFSPGNDTTQRFTFYPGFKDLSAFRAEAEVIAQASMTNRLALKVGYLFRYSNVPSPGFVRSDSTATASVVLRWKATTPASVP